MFAGVGMSVRGEQPYPGFSNLGNICFITAVFQCLLRCADAQAYLAALPVARPGDAPAVLLNDALRQLTSDCRQGIEAPAVYGQRAFYDVCSPTCLVDAFCRVAPPTYKFGDFYDACEAFAKVLASTGIR